MAKNLIKKSVIEDAYEKGWFTIWRLGTEQYPASPEELKTFKKMLKKIYNGEEDSIIWNHAVDYILVDPNMRNKIIWRLGTEAYPASCEDIKRFQKKLAKAFKNKKKYLVWGLPIDFIVRTN